MPIYSVCCVYNVEVEDFHSYFVGDASVLVHNYMSNQQANNLKNKVLAGEDLTFSTLDEALEFINKKFGTFPQETAGHRSAQGWHYDEHFIESLNRVAKHINIYSKSGKFSVHLFWGD